MEYICVRKKQRRNVVPIALFIRENSVGTERMLRVLSNGRAIKKMKKERLFT